MEKSFPARTPTALINLILKFAYNLTCADLDFLFAETVIVTRSLPVPQAWKRLLTIDPAFNVYKFRPDILLKGCMHPHHAKTHISLKAVRETVKLLNWPHLQRKLCVCNAWVRANTKKYVLQILQRWNPQTIRFIFELQRTLCAVTCRAV